VNGVALWCRVDWRCGRVRSSGDRNSQGHCGRVSLAVLANGDLGGEARGRGARSNIARAVSHGLSNDGSNISSGANINIRSSNHGRDGFLCAGRSRGVGVRCGRGINDRGSRYG
jgi:hypothetical protein